MDDSSNGSAGGNIDPFDVVSSLCANNCKVSVRDLFGRTPLHYAALSSAALSLLCLIKKGAEIEAEDLERNTPLAVAFLHRKAEVATFLIQNKADTSKLMHSRVCSAQQQSLLQSKPLLSRVKFLGRKAVA